MEKITVGQLLKRFKLDTGIQQKEVAEKLGLSPQRVNHYFRDIADPPFEFYTKFREAFNVDLKQQLNKDKKRNANNIGSTNPLPVYDLELESMKDLDFFNYPELISYYIDAPLYHDCFAFLKVTGIAMSPSFNPSDIIAIKKINNLDIVPPGEPYYIITEEHRLLRYIRNNKTDSKNNFLLRAVNADFDDMIIKKTDIKHLFQVKGKITTL